MDTDYESLEIAPPKRKRSQHTYGRKGKTGTSQPQAQVGRGAKGAEATRAGQTSLKDGRRISSKAKLGKRDRQSADEQGEGNSESESASDASAEGGAQVSCIVT